MTRYIRHLLATLALAASTALHAQEADTATPASPPETLPMPGALPDPVGGGIPPPELEELRKPLTIFVRGGRRFDGTLAGFDGEKLSLRTIQAGGEIVMSFPQEDIERIFFPGGSILEATRATIRSGDMPAALPYLEALLAIRYPIFPLLPPDQRSLYAEIPFAALSIDRPAAAIAYVEALRPYYTREGDLEKLRAAELLGRYILDLSDEAREQAENRIEREGRFPESALGHFVLGAIQFREGSYADSLQTSLEPIVFTGQIPVPYLGHCYALAVASTHVLGNDKHRDQLLGEMRERGIPWQPLRALAAAEEELADLVVTDENGESLPLFEAATEDERLLETIEESVGTENFIDPSSLIPL